MRVFDAATEAVKQGGTRRGANMGILAHNHPDIVDFIDSKLDGKTLSNFNISVGITEEFMEMAEQNMDYDLVNPHTKEVVGQLNAQDVLDRIAQNAWNTGDPGVLFLDRIDRANPTPHIGAMTYEAQEKAALDIAERVLKALRGRYN